MTVKHLKYAHTHAPYKQTHTHLTLTLTHTDTCIHVDNHTYTQKQYQTHTHRDSVTDTPSPYPVGHRPRHRHTYKRSHIHTHKHKIKHKDARTHRFSDRYPFSLSSRGAINDNLELMRLAQRQAFGQWFSRAMAPLNMTSGARSLIRDTGNLIVYLPFQSFQHLSPAQVTVAVASS